MNGASGSCCREAHTGSNASPMPLVYDLTTRPMRLKRFIWRPREPEADMSDGRDPAVSASIPVRR